MLGDLCFVDPSSHPLVPPRSSHVVEMSALVPASLQPTLATILSVLPSTIPRPLRWIFWTLLLVNIQHFPGVWHARVIWPFIRFQWEAKLGRVWKNWRIGVEDVRKFKVSPLDRMWIVVWVKLKLLPVPSCSRQGLSELRPTVRIVSITAEISGASLQRRARAQC